MTSPDIAALVEKVARAISDVPIAKELFPCPTGLNDEDAENVARAALAAIEASGRWQLVPTKWKREDSAVLAGLTHEMCDAFWAAFEKANEHHGHRESTSAGYNALLAAAPKPE